MATAIRLGWWAVALAACGDNLELPCTPPAGELPTQGPFRDPLEVLPDGCLTDGLRDLPGRWFVVNPTETFDYRYPRFEGSCEAGLREAQLAPDDHDEADGDSLFTWSDGTRYYERYHRRFDTGGQVYEYAGGIVACMTDYGVLSVMGMAFDPDHGESLDLQRGTRFGRKDDDALGLELVGALATRSDGGRLEPFNLAIDGDRVYTAGPLGLDIIDVSDPAHPTALGRLRGSLVEANDIRVLHGLDDRVVAFLAPRFDGETRVIDVTVPADATQIATIPEYSHSLQLVGTQLYLATYGDTVPSYDVTDPVAPVRLGETTVPGEPAGVHDLTVDGDRLYVNDTTAGFVAIDATTGRELGRIATSYSHASAIGTTTSGRRIILHGDEGMTGTADGGAFLRVVEGDPRSPSYMHEIGRYQSRRQVGIHNIELVGDRAYIAYYQDGVRVVDLSTPEQPREIAHFNTWDPETAFGGTFEGAIGIRVAGGLIYVADTERGLLILRER